MAPRTLISFAGFILLIAGLFSPLISPLGLVKWNLFDLNKIFAIIILLVAVAGLFSTLVKNNQFRKITAWIAFALVTLVFIAVVMKVKTAFSFIPFPKLANTMSGFIHYRWGWYLLFAGSVLAVLGTFGGGRKSLHTTTSI